MAKHRGQRVGSVRRIGLLLLGLMLVASLTFGVARAGDKSVRLGAATAKPLLGVNGNVARFQSQTGQARASTTRSSTGDRARPCGSPFAALFPTLAPIPMLHIGTKGKERARGDLAGRHRSRQGRHVSGRPQPGDRGWNKGIYVRPLAEMNNAATLWPATTANGQPRDAAHSPATFRKAFARIYVILHGGSASAVNAKLSRSDCRRSSGGELLANPFPRLADHLEPARE